MSLSKTYSPTLGGQKRKSYGHLSNLDTEAVLNLTNLEGGSLKRLGGIDTSAPNSPRPISRANSGALLEAMGAFSLGGMSSNPSFSSDTVSGTGARSVPTSPLLRGKALSTSNPSFSSQHLSVAPVTGFSLLASLDTLDAPKRPYRVASGFRRSRTDLSTIATGSASLPADVLHGGTSAAGPTAIQSTGTPNGEEGGTFGVYRFFFTPESQKSQAAYATSAATGGTAKEKSDRNRIFARLRRDAKREQVRSLEEELEKLRLEFEKLSHHKWGLWREAACSPLAASPTDLSSPSPILNSTVLPGVLNLADPSSISSIVGDGPLLSGGRKNSGSGGRGQVGPRGGSRRNSVPEVSSGTRGRRSTRLAAVCENTFKIALGMTSQDADSESLHSRHSSGSSSHHKNPLSCSALLSEERALRNAETTRDTWLTWTESASKLHPKNSPLCAAATSMRTSAIVHCLNDPLEESVRVTSTLLSLVQSASKLCGQLSRHSPQAIEELEKYSEERVWKNRMIQSTSSGASPGSCVSSGQRGRVHAGVKLTGSGGEKGSSNHSDSPRSGDLHSFPPTGSSTPTFSLHAPLASHTNESSLRANLDRINMGGDSFAERGGEGGAFNDGSSLFIQTHGLTSESELNLSPNTHSLCSTRSLDSSSSILGISSSLAKNFSGSVVSSSKDLHQVAGLDLLQQSEEEAVPFSVSPQKLHEPPQDIVLSQLLSILKLSPSQARKLASLSEGQGATWSSLNSSSDGIPPLFFPPHLAAATGRSYDLHYNGGGGGGGVGGGGEGEVGGGEDDGSFSYRKKVESEIGVSHPPFSSLETALSESLKAQKFISTLLSPLALSTPPSEPPTTATNTSWGTPAPSAAAMLTEYPPLESSLVASREWGWPSYSGDATVDAAENAALMVPPFPSSRSLNGSLGAKRTSLLSSSTSAGAERGAQEGEEGGSTKVSGGGGGARLRGYRTPNPTINPYLHFSIIDVVSQPLMDLSPQCASALFHWAEKNGSVIKSIPLLKTLRVKKKRLLLQQQQQQSLPFSSSSLASNSCQEQSRLSNTNEFQQLGLSLSPPLLPTKTPPKEIPDFLLSSTT